MQDPMRSVYFTGLPEEHYKLGNLYKNQIVNFIEKVTNVGVVEKTEFNYNKIIVVFKKDKTVDSPTGTSKELFLKMYL